MLKNFSYHRPKWCSFPTLKRTALAFYAAALIAIAAMIVTQSSPGTNDSGAVGAGPPLRLNLVSSGGVPNKAVSRPTMMQQKTSVPVLHALKKKTAMRTTVARDSGRSMETPAHREATIQFKEGLDEDTVPDVLLFRSPGGDQGTAIFRFKTPTLYQHVDLEQEVDGMAMIDDEGEIVATEVAAQFSERGVPMEIEAKYKMHTIEEWDRFMRFMDRFARTHGLEFELSDSVSNDHLRHKDLERELTKYVEEVEKAGHSFIHMFLPPQSPTAS
mmetsp:Transcript_18838/g.36366  ORF Transcript_18838/g.36366 Transcript_18838/m.36366 type:complete len:272 (+) Transcript_18838:278-1093(+)